MPANEPRRWLSFSLRTLFVVMTVGCVWLGWEARIVRERKAVLRDLRNVVVLFASTQRYQPLTEAIQLGSQIDYGYLRISLTRRLLGDEPYVEIYLLETTPPELVERTEHAFPEAKLYGDWHDGPAEFRDSLYKPASERMPNYGLVFKTGLSKDVVVRAAAQ